MVSLCRRFVGALFILGVPFLTAANAEQRLVDVNCFVPSVGAEIKGESGFGFNISTPFGDLPILFDASSRQLTPNEISRTPGAALVPMSFEFSARLNSAASAQDIKGKRIIITISCKKPTPSVNFVGGTVLPIDYEFSGFSSVQTAGESTASENALEARVVKAVTDAIKAGHLTDAQVKTAVDRIQLELNTNVQKALVADVSSKLGTANIVNRLDELQKTIQQLQNEIAALKKSPAKQ